MDLFGINITKKRIIKHGTNYNQYYTIDYKKKHFRKDFLHVNASKKFRLFKHKNFYESKTLKNLKRDKRYFKADGSCFNNNPFLNSYIKRCNRFYIFY